MAFKVRNKRQEDGSYELSYGKGKRKLIAHMTANGSVDGWGVPEGDGADILGGFKTMRDCKEAWGEWAARKYASDGSGPAATVDGPPAASPPAPPTVGPPSLPPPPSLPKPKPRDLDLECNADPFSLLYRYPSDHPDELKRQQITPLGVLVEIDAWVKRYGRRITQISAELEKTAPHFNPFDPLVQSVRDCLAREVQDTDEDADVA